MLNKLNLNKMNTQSANTNTKLQSVIENELGQKIVKLEVKMNTFRTNEYSYANFLCEDNQWRNSKLTKTGKHVKKSIRYAI